MKTGTSSLVSIEWANPFRQKGVWLKGNTHTHTVNSDGTWTVEEVREGYGRHGYDFVFLTDHWKRTVPPRTSAAGPLLIPAEEVDFVVGPNLYHAVCLGLREEWRRRSFRSVAEFVRLAHRRCEYLIMAHPYWSGTRSEGYLGVGEFAATEVYNTGVDRSIAKGYSGTYWDDFLDAGLRVMGIAADDAHNAASAFGSCIMVKAGACTERSILTAMRRGHYYSTLGPTIHDIQVVDKRVTIKCSPVWRINFVANGYLGSVVYAQDRELTEATWTIHPDVTRFRIECVDRAGNTAWSNPIWQVTNRRLVARLRRETMQKVVAPRLGAAVGGDPNQLDWSSARVLKPWRGLMGERTRRQVEGRIAHDGQYLYLQLEERLDPRKLLVNGNTVWSEDEWEIFFSDCLGKPCRQMGVNAKGTHLAVDHGAPLLQWRNGAKVISNTSLPDRWQVRIALPLAKLVRGGARAGDTFHMNIVRSTEQGDAVAWVPTFKSYYHEPNQLGAVRLE